MGKTAIRANLADELNQIRNAEIKRFVGNALHQVTKGTKRAPAKMEGLSTAIGYAKVVVYYAAKLSRLNKATEFEHDQIIASCLLGQIFKALGAEKGKLLRATEGFHGQQLITEIITRVAEKGFQGSVVIEELSAVDRIVLCASHLVAPRNLFDMPNVDSRRARKLDAAA